MPIALAVAFVLYMAWQVCRSMSFSEQTQRIIASFVLVLLFLCLLSVMGLLPWLGGRTV